MKDSEKYQQMKYSNVYYMQQIYMLYSIFQIYSGTKIITDTTYAVEIPTDNETQQNKR